MEGARKRFGRAWLLLTVAVGVHVADEAANDFLALYNPTVARLRERFEWFPMPQLQFEGWLTSLSIGIVVLLLLTMAAYHGSKGMRVFAYVYAGAMLVNGLAHIGIAIYLRELAAGVLSAPLLVAGSVNLLVCARRIGNAEHGVK